MVPVVPDEGEGCVGEGQDMESRTAIEASKALLGA